MMKKLLLIMIAVVMVCAGCTGQQDEVAVSAAPSPLVETPSPEPTTTPEPTPAPTPTPEPTPEPLPLSGTLICVDPGHCVTPYAGKGYQDLVSPLSTETKTTYTTGTQGANITEEQLNLMVGLKLRDALEALGADVIMTREVSEITINGTERCEIANEAGVDVCVSLHADGSTDSSVHGVSVLIPTGDLLGTPSIVEESARLGTLMVNAVAEETGAYNRGTTPRSDLTGFNFSEHPAVLIEMGFMTNPEEDALMETDAYQDQIVTGIVNSLLAWYEV